MNDTVDLGVLDLELSDIDGIGETVAKKMEKMGITSVMQLASMSSEELVDKIDCAKDTAQLHIQNAQNLLRETDILDKEFQTAEESLEKRKEVLRLSTGSKELDTLLKGGIESQAMTEFYGEYGSGKSQICFTCSVLATQPKGNGGLDTNVIFFDTEGTFRSERIAEIAGERGLDIKSVLKRINHSKIYNSGHLEYAIKNLTEYIEKYNVKLIIIDSIMSLHRAEYVGRGTLSERQQKVNNFLHRLVRIAEIYNIIILVTNQIQHDPGNLFGDPVKPVGGNAIGHTATYRIYIKKSGHNRIVTMIDSPYHEYSSCKITVTKLGITDLEEEKKK
jgi:DNA repair protein RadA